MYSVHPPYSHNLDLRPSRTYQKLDVLGVPPFGCLLHLFVLCHLPGLTSRIGGGIQIRVLAELTLLLQKGSQPLHGLGWAKALEGSEGFGCCLMSTSD